MRFFQALRKYFYKSTCYWLVAGLLAGLGGCVSSPVQPQKLSAEELALGRASVVTLGIIKLDPTKPSTLSWKSPIEVFGGNNPGRLQSLKQVTQAAIEQQIARKGYPLFPVGGDFQMNAIVVLDNETMPVGEKHSELLGKTGVDPGLIGSDSSHGRGSLVIELRQGNALRWRGAVQIYILPEYEEGIVAQRVEYAVGQLLSTWP